MIMAKIMGEQMKTVLHHLETKGEITSIEAFDLYGYSRLSSVVFQLRHRHGVPISTKQIPVPPGSPHIGVYVLDRAKWKKRKEELEES